MPLFHRQGSGRRGTKLKEYDSLGYELCGESKIFSIFSFSQI